MTELLLVRHGRPESGLIDPPLNDEGIAQARRLAMALEGAGVTALISSDLRRARQTADIVGETVGHASTTLPGLREWGLPADAMEYVALELLDGDDPRSTAIAEGRFMDFVPDVVDLAAFRATVVDAFDEILANNRTGRVAVVCHGGTINAYVGHLAGIPDVFWFHPDYASVSRVERLPGGRVVIRSLNEAARLLVESN